MAVSLLQSFAAICFSIIRSLIHLIVPSYHHLLQVLINQLNNPPAIPAFAFADQPLSFQFLMKLLQVFHPDYIVLYLIVSFCLLCSLVGFAFCGCCCCCFCCCLWKGKHPPPPQYANHHPRITHEIAIQTSSPTTSPLPTSYDQLHASVAALQAGALANDDTSRRRSPRIRSLHL